MIARRAGGDNRRSPAGRVDFTTPRPPRCKTGRRRGPARPALHCPPTSKHGRKRGGVTDFGDRLDKAIDRGRRIKERSERKARGAEMTREEAKSRHTEGRLALTEAIEAGLKAVADRFPGFDFSSVYSEDGWGGRISRDDLNLGGRGPREQYSRLELVVPPLGEAAILSLAGKGTVRNKEVFSRTHFQKLEDLDLEAFGETLDLWVIEYAERYSAAS